MIPAPHPVGVLHGPAQPIGPPQSCTTTVAPERSSSSSTAETVSCVAVVGVPGWSWLNVRAPRSPAGQGTTTRWPALHQRRSMCRLEVGPVASPVEAERPADPSPSSHSACAGRPPACSGARSRYREVLEALVRRVRKTSIPRNTMRSATATCRSAASGAAELDYGRSWWGPGGGAAAWEATWAFAPPCHAR